MELLRHINSLSAAEREAFERSANTTIGYLRKAVSTKQRIGPSTCVDIERATSGAVTRRDLRPDDWHRIWPELVTAEHPAPTEAAA